jgi:hypothetical protein
MASIDHTSQSSLRQRRLRSISSDKRSRTTNGYGGLLSPPFTVSPDPVFIDASVASQIVTNDLDSHADTSFFKYGSKPSAETELVTLPAVKLVNRFLDQLLFNFLSVSRSTSLASLRPAVAEVLGPKLAKDAITGADREIHEYLGDAEEDEESWEVHNELEPGKEWDLELVWKRTRLRCMLYSSLRSMDEDYEVYYTDQEHLLDAPHGVISPAVGIFLTFILEYIGEYVLVFAGQAAYNKLRAKHEKKEQEQDGTSTPADIVERVVVEETDVEKVTLDGTLGRLWRGSGYLFSGDFSDPTETATAMSRDSGYASMASKQLLERESNESDTKSIASLESRITSASSLSPAGVGGAVEEFAEILLDNEEIRQCVKRGFVTMDSDRFERNFIRLLKRYASELRTEADSHIEKSATRIVHSYRAYVTRIIRRRVLGLDEDDSQASAFHSIKDQTTTKLTLERFLSQQQPTETSDQADSRPEDEQESNGDSQSDEEEPYLPNLEKLTNFLVSSTAFKNFKARLESFVKSNSELQQILEDSSSRVGQTDEHVPIKQPKNPGFLRQIKNVLRRSLRPPIPPGSQRIEWICVGLPNF